MRVSADLITKLLVYVMLLTPNVMTYGHGYSDSTHYAQSVDNLSSVAGIRLFSS